MTETRTSPLQSYLMGAIDTETDTTDAKQILAFLYERFVNEYWYDYNRKYYRNNARKAFASWLMGLPSATNVAFANYDILNLGVLFDLLPANADENAEETFFLSWFDLCANAYFDLFKSYGII